MALGQLIEEYAGAIKVIIIALALIAIILVLCSTTEAGGVVLNAFKTMLTDFYTKASALGGISTP